MCFSFEASIGTFIISWSISLYLLHKGLAKKQRQNIIFLMIFSSMQLLDAILWYIKMKKNSINYFITFFMIPFVLNLQIFYNIFIINEVRNKFLAFIMLISFLFGNHIRYLMGGDGKYSIPSKNMFSSPIWGSEYQIISMIVFIYLITYGRIGFFGEKLMFSIIISISFLFSFILSGGYGSIWCALANILAFYYLYKYR